jgi:methylated-DNA-protein-cysteine methyltransferase-like protein
VKAPSSYARIYATVRRIPKGRVATYGQVAELAGLPRAARQVGYAMAALRPGARVPWQRVVNARGEVSARGEPGAEELQRLLLEREGVRFDAAGRIDLARHGWRPMRAAAKARSRSSQGRPARAR